MKNSIVFLDWHNTLCNGLFWQQLKVSDADLHKKIIETLFFKGNAEAESMFEAWMVGRETSKSVCAWIASRVGTSEQALHDELLKSCLMKTLPEGFSEIVQKIRSHAYVVLVTDHADVFLSCISPNLKLSDFFDRIIVSHAIGRMKKDENGRTFSDYAKEVGIPLSETYFIDDSKDNCAAFESLGGHAKRTTSIEDTLDQLRKIQSDLASE